MHSASASQVQVKNCVSCGKAGTNSEGSRADLGVVSIKLTQADLGLPSRAKLVCSSIDVENFLAPLVSLQVGLQKLTTNLIVND